MCNYKKRQFYKETSCMIWVNGAVFQVNSQAGTRGVMKKDLKISQNSQENTCGRVSFFDKVAG